MLEWKAPAFNGEEFGAEMAKRVHFIGLLGLCFENNPNKYY